MKKLLIKAIVYETAMFIMAIGLTYLFFGDFGKSILLTILITLLKIPIFMCNDKIWGKFK